MIEMQQPYGVGVKEALKRALERAQQAGDSVMLRTEIKDMLVLPSMTRDDLEALYQEFNRILYEEI